MSKSVNIYTEISDLKSRERLYQSLSEDWSISWKIVSRESNRLNPTQTNIAIFDNMDFCSSIDKKVIKIFIGDLKGEDADFFSVLPDFDHDALLKEVKRAYSYRETTLQNLNSLYPKLELNESLQSIAKSLSDRVHQLMRQAEMRIALVDQMPVGVVGIDDDDIVVLVNPAAIEMLNLNEVPVWGLPTAAIFPQEVVDFIEDDRSQIVFEREGKQLMVRNGDFTLNDEFAGTILILWPVDNDLDGS